MSRKRCREWQRKRKRNYYSPLIQPSEHCGPADVAYLDEEIMIEARVNVSPEVTIGRVRMECLDYSLDPCDSICSCSNDCSYVINQLIRVSIPVRFGAKAEVESCGVGCSSIRPCC